nr:MAG TPA: hypothetical protein [Caudoviricetes sp.]
MRSVNPRAGIGQRAITQRIVFSLGYGSFCFLGVFQWQK